MIRVLFGLTAKVAVALACAGAASLALAAKPGTDLAGSAYVEVEGGRLHVVTLGPRAERSGVPIVLLHGASGNLRDMELSIGRRLAERRRVILIDRPGHGRSDRLGGREMASPARQADAIAQALDRMGVGRTVVVGHSWSGALAANLALDHPGHVAGLALLSPATHPYPGGSGWYNDIATLPLIGDLFIATVVGPIGRSRFVDGVKTVFKPRDPPPEYIERTEAMLLLRPSEFRANAQDLVDLKPFLTRQASRYDAIRAPTVIVTADKDGIVSPEIHSRAIHRQIRGSKLVVLEGVGHMPHWNATDRVVQEIEAIAAKAR